MRQRQTMNGSFGTRRGLATLELALALPVLAVMAAVLFVAARAGLARLEATLDARQKAWKQRHGAPPGGSLAIRPGPEELVKGEASHPIKRPAILGAIVPHEAQAQHSVLAGSLDYHSIPLNNPPELTFAQVMAGTLLPNGGDSLAGLVPNASDLSSQLEGQLSGMMNLVDAKNQQIANAKQNLANAQQQLAQRRRDLQNQIKQAEQQVQGLSRDVDRFKKQLTDLDNQRTQAEGIKDKTKRKKALDAIDRQEKTIKGQQAAEAKQLDAAKQQLLRLRFAELADQHLAP
jgi:hypothetical protein